jgi:hypothetical protein
MIVWSHRSPSLECAAYNDVFLAIAVLALCALAALTLHVGVAAIGRRLALAPVPQPAAS